MATSDVIPTPPGEDFLIRRIEALEQRVKELGPSVAKSVSGIVAAMVQLDEIYDFENPFSGTVGSVLDVMFYRTVPVPTGYTQAFVVGQATADIRNTSGSSDYAYVSCGIGTNHPVAGLNLDSGISAAELVPNGSWSEDLRAMNLKTEVSLNDETEIAVALMARTGSGGSVTKGTGTVTAIVIFTR